MIVSRNQLRELRSKRDSQVKYESKQTAQNTIYQEDQQTMRSISFHSTRAMSQLNFNSTINKKPPIKTSSNNKCDTQYNEQSTLKHSADMRKKYEKMSFDIDLTRRNLKQFIVTMPNSINVRQIYSLNLSQNHIKEILPTVLVPFESLKQLNLSGNQLEKISFPYNKMKLRTLQIQRNSLTNLNLQHLKCLESVNASHNKLIFITLPQSLKILNLNHNMLSNMYFIEKCEKIEQITMNFNFIYDFTFNSINQLDCITKKQVQCPRFYRMSKIECSHNKITHLNGFFNIKYVKYVSLQFNELSLNRQNLNELFYLENVENLNLSENPLEGTYGISTALDFLIKKLPKLQMLNSQAKGVFQAQLRKNRNLQSHQQDQSELECSINNESSIDEKSESLQNSQQKPFRLFMDEDISPMSLQKDNSKMGHKKSVKKPKSTKQWIYTLGDTQSKPDENDSQIFKLMTLCNQEINKQTYGTNKQTYDTNKQTYETNKKNPNCKQSIHKSSKKLIQLEEQILNKNKQVEISLSNIEFGQEQFQLSYESRNILKMIFEMSFVPPAPLKYSSKSQLLSKRLDEDTDEYILFSKLFQKRKGILYLKKIYLVQETDQLFGFEDNTQQYELSFFNHPNVQQFYNQMSRANCLLEQAKISKQNITSIDISHYLSPVPNSFGCHHIVVRNLKGKISAFDKRHFAPVCYLIESKNI